MAQHLPQIELPSPSIQYSVDCLCTIWSDARARNMDFEKNNQNMFIVRIHYLLLDAISLSRKLSVLKTLIIIKLWVHNETRIVVTLFIR